MIRWTLLLIAVAVILWWLTHRASPSVTEIPWRSGPNVFDCQQDAPLQPMPGVLDADQQARILEKLREACRGETK